MPALVSGLGPVHRAHLAAALALRCERPLCVIVPDDASAETMAGALRSFLGADVVTVTGREFTFYAAESVSGRRSKSGSGPWTPWPPIRLLRRWSRRRRC